jgi:putative endopeptidase
MAPYLNAAVVDEAFSFHVRDMTGQPKQKPLWKRVASQVGEAVEESLGRLYVERHFSPEAKQTCQGMVDALVAVLAARFDPETGVDWMSDATKKRALEKLSRFRAKIGYPDVWRVEHCDGLAKQVGLGASYAANIRAAAKCDVQRALARVNKPIDKERWYMPPFMVNGELRRRQEASRARSAP